ncbi:MAG: OmpH family outer membrane protein [Saprospirales bacterium]|nr:OmpH family outer membrane protein [Saprospirales bacterium]
MPRQASGIHRIETGKPAFPEEQQAREKELLKLDEDLQKQAADAEYNLQAKRQDLLNPVLEKLQNAINEVARENGYTHVLNQTTSGGVSTILYGPPEDDLTEKIFNKLGMQIPKE